MTGSHNYGYRRDLKEADSILYRRREKRTKAGERIPGALPKGTRISVRPEGYRSEEGGIPSPLQPAGTTAEVIQGREAIAPNEAVNNITRSQLGDRIVRGEDVTN